LRLSFNIDAIQGFWQISFDSIMFDGKTFLGTTSVMIDTGTAQVVGDTNTVQAIYNHIPGSAAVGGGIWTCTFVRWFAGFEWLID
jgi:hypothetical protein